MAKLVKIKEKSKDKWNLTRIFFFHLDHTKDFVPPWNV